MITNSDDFSQIFNKTNNFIEKLKLKPITIKSQDDIDFVYGKISNLTIWLSGNCDLMYFDFVDEVESIFNKVYDEETISEYSECINDICEQINLENLTDEMIINLIEPSVNPNKSSVTIEELSGGDKDRERKYLRINLLFILFFSMLSMFLVFYLYEIFSGQNTPTIGQTVYTLHTKHTISRPYVIESQWQIYDYLIARIITAVVHFWFSIYVIRENADEFQRKIGKISFVKLLNLTFDEQNQIVKYITNKIEGMSDTKQIEPTISKQVIEIPELRKIKSSNTKPKLSIQIPDIFMSPKAAMITDFDKTTVKSLQEYNQNKLTEIKEVQEKTNIFKIMSKCVPSIFKKIKKSKK